MLVQHRPKPINAQGMLALIGILFLFLGHRLFFLFFTHPDYLFVYADEELYRGLFARDLIQGLQLPLLDYRPDNFAGGFFVVSVITSLFFRVFGMSIFALKMTPLLFSMLGLVFWHLFLQRRFDSKTAFLFSIFYIFAPFDFIHYGLANLGDHAETICFSGLALLLMDIAIQRTRTNYLLIFALGLLLGFATWFSYISIMVAITIAFYLIIFNRKQLTKQFFVSGCTGALLGFFPWVWFNLQNRFVGFMIRDESIWDLFHAEGILSLFSVKPYSILHKFFSSFAPHHMEPLGLRTILYAYLAILAIGGFLMIMKLMSSSEKSEKQMIVMLIFYPTFLIILLSMCDFKFVRYLIPAHPFIYALLAWAMVSQTGILPRMLRNGVIITWVLCGITSVSSLQAKENSTFITSAGYDLSRIPLKDHCYQVEDCLKHYDAIHDQLSHEDLKELQIHFANEIAENRIQYENLEQSVEEMLKRLPPELVADFIYALGIKVLRMEQSIERATNRLYFLSRWSREHYLLAMHGALDEMGAQPHFHATPSVLKSQQAKKLLDELESTYWETQGRLMARTLYLENLSFQDTLEQIKNLKQSQMLNGFGQFIFEIWHQQMLKPHPWLSEAKELWTSEGTEILKGIGVAYEYQSRSSHKRPWVWMKLTGQMTETQMQIVRGSHLEHRKSISLLKRS